MRFTTRATALTLASLLAVSVAVAPAASAAGDKSLASVLTSGKQGFDKDWHDYDIVTAAVLAVINAKPESPVALLTDGSVALTAFIPNDRAFQKLVTALTGTTPKTEKATFNAVAGLGIDTVETVLLYHVVPGATITSKKALKANGATLDTALAGKTIKVRVTKAPAIILRDENTTLRNARVILKQVDINKGNKQIAHGIDAVIMPAL
jgi:uncharacterized surface protein with fasciclin (FAS1) repeats